MQRASETLIPVTLELGGKDSFIVCEDVDLPNVRVVYVAYATNSVLYSRSCSSSLKLSVIFSCLKVVQVAVRAALQSSGQNCAGAERFYVHNDIYSAFVSQVVKIVNSICVVSMQTMCQLLLPYLLSLVLFNRIATFCCQFCIIIFYFCFMNYCKHMN